MPANLPPTYRKAEEEFRKARTPTEQVMCLEKLLTLIPKHKGTEHLQADLKTRLKEARAEVQSEKKSPTAGRSYRIPRQGAGTVVLIGAPNSGRSRIIAELTNAEPEVAAYPFTTQEPLPAMMPCEGAFAQLIDTPPVAEGHLEPYLINYVRSADLVLLCFDGSSDDAPEETHAVIEQFSSRKTVFSKGTGFDENDFSRLRIRTLLTATRGGDPDVTTRLDLFRDQISHDFGTVTVELDNESDRETLRYRIFDELQVIRVFTKTPGKPATYEEPFTIPIGGTVEDLAESVHREIAEKLKFARVWGSEVHDGQSVGKDHVLSEGDMVELHT